MYEYITENSWKIAVKDEFEENYMKELITFLEKEKALGKNILPSESNWFNALNSTPIEQVKVFILGQDPYPTLGHAHGLCFSALDPINPLPKSLQNIYKELKSDLNIDNTHTANLQPWANQGVLLLNAILTVEEGKSNAHKNKGWENFTDKTIQLINEKCENVVFILWGAYAQKKAKYIDNSKHLIIKDPHPSPLSAYRGFWDSKPFSKANDYLAQHHKETINWVL
ncbi:MAG: Uracil-DNA glycosylase, family 1 [uncultured Sulfurovum sp.]|uniref:Uracil-DNA glycosylase n=1 Tax=uncultured Sulfurovum sp. TaxID=269237 RepID=A0A6S6SBB9_9BACT|nr:MAG: Uracil-DNA glycosylase, family 1 [uncultured Sulfurovum sp.]